MNDGEAPTSCDETSHANLSSIRSPGRGAGEVTCISDALSFQTDDVATHPHTTQMYALLRRLVVQLEELTAVYEAERHARTAAEAARQEAEARATQSARIAQRAVRQAHQRETEASRLREDACAPCTECARNCARVAVLSGALEHFRAEATPPPPQIRCPGMRAVRTVFAGHSARGLAERASLATALRGQSEVGPLEWLAAAECVASAGAPQLSWGDVSDLTQGLFRPQPSPTPSATCTPKPGPPAPPPRGAAPPPGGQRLAKSPPPRRRCSASPPRAQKCAVSAARPASAPPRRLSRSPVPRRRGRSRSGPRGSSRRGRSASRGRSGSRCRSVVGDTAGRARSASRGPVLPEPPQFEAEAALLAAARRMLRGQQPVEIRLSAEGPVGHQIVEAP
eukprot:Hpha_TRINITY_DN12700_c0_g1::TRINITY_DN12700_c0_g1_i1::g.114478::m.114478